MNNIKKKIAISRGSPDITSSPALSQDSFYSNNYSELNIRESPVLPESNIDVVQQTSRSKSLKHKTSLLFKKTSITKESLVSNANALTDRFTKIRASPGSPSLNTKVQISGPQDFKHLFHMDTSSNDPNSVPQAPNDIAQPTAINSYKPSPSSMTTSLFSDDYFNNAQYPGTPSSPISSTAPPSAGQLLSSVADKHFNKKLSSSASTTRTSITNSVNSVFDKSNTTKRSEGLRSSSFSSNIGNSEFQKYQNNLTIPECTSQDKEQNDVSFSNPFSENNILLNEESDNIQFRSRQNSSSSLLSQQSSISNHSRRLLQSEAKLENSDHTLKRNKFLNETSPVPRFQPPALPASPAHTSRSEDSAQTIKYDTQLLIKEECISPISNTTSYVTPKLSDIMNSDSQQFTAEFNPEQFQRPELHSIPSLKSLKKSKSFLSLKKSFNKHLQTVGLTKKIQFKNSNDSVASLGSDKSLTGFSPDIETNNANGRPLSVSQNNEVQLKDLISPTVSNSNEEAEPEVLKHQSFEKDAFDVDFEKEMAPEKRNSSNSRQSKSSVVEQLRSRHNTISSKQSSNLHSQNDASISSNFSAVSYNTTKPTSTESPEKQSSSNVASAEADNRRSSVYIRQSWLKDEALAIFKDTDFAADTSFDSFDKSNEPAKENQTLEDDILPLSVNVTKKQALSNMKLLNHSYDNFIVGKTAFAPLHEKPENVSVDDITAERVEKELLAIQSEMEFFHESEETGESSFLLRRRSENDLSNIAMLEVEPEKLDDPELTEVPASNAPTKNKKDLKRLTLHTPTYLLDFAKEQSPATPGFFINDNSSNTNTNRLSIASSKNTIFLATPTKKFGHGKSLSIASSIYSNGAGDAAGHSRSSSLYNNEIRASAEDLAALLRPKPVGTDEVSVAPLTKKKIAVDRNSYIQFNFNKIDDFKAGLDELNE